MNFSFLMRYQIPSLFTPATTGTTLLPGLWSGNHSLGMRQKVPREEHSDFLVIKSGITPQRSIHGKGVKLAMDHCKLTKLSSTWSVENFRNKEMKGALLIPHICVLIIDVPLGNACPGVCNGALKWNKMTEIKTCLEQENQSCSLWLVHFAGCGFT